MPECAENQREIILSERGQLALGYAERGWYVFPIAEGTKNRPRVPWSRAASTDPQEIAAWWQTYPNDNIGIACGPSSLCVIDLDVRPTKNGVSELDVLEVLHGKLPATLTANTPSGGRHLYFSGRTKNTNGKLAQGIDCKSLGGYVLAPGSAINGQRYEWTNDCDTAPLPSWVSQKIGEARERANGDPPPDRFDHPADIAWARRYLRDTEAKPEGSGSDNQTYEIACKLRDRGLSEETAFELMCTEWSHPHEESWVREKVKNAYRYATGEAGSESTAAFDEAPDISPKRRRFQPRKFSELLTLSSPKWLVERLIPEAGLALLYGKPKVGKTFWSLDLSLSIATGRSFHGIPVQRGRVTYVAAEGGPSRLCERVSAWLKRRNVAANELEGWWDLISTPVDLADRAQLAEMLHELSGQRSLVVFDTLARCMSGDENAQKDMSAAVQGSDRVREETGAAVLLVHHEGKDSSKGARGSTVLRGAIDTSIRARNEGCRIVFSVEDQRDDEPLPASHFELIRVAVGENAFSATLMAIETGVDNDRDTLKIRDIASEMRGAPKKDLIAAVVDELGLKPMTARRRVDAAIPKRRELAVEHASGLLWLEPDAKNPQGSVTVCYEPHD